MILFHGLSSYGHGQITGGQDFEKLTVSTAAVALTAAKVKGKSVAVVTVDITNGLRMRDDGAAPTATDGIAAAGGVQFYLYGASLGQVKFIRSGGADAVIQVQYY